VQVSGEQGSEPFDGTDFRHQDIGGRISWRCHYNQYLNVKCTVLRARLSSVGTVRMNMKVLDKCRSQSWDEKGRTFAMLEIEKGVKQLSLGLKKTHRISRV
ncbi:hypothetical protein, partial [Thiocystis violacea]|uniref:hypothetical protein n=1 Tax=Thiocystis violacea TaxID=13725 RepID=UPI001A90E990